MPALLVLPILVVAAFVVVRILRFSRVRAEVFSMHLVRSPKPASTITVGSAAKNATCTTCHGSGSVTQPQQRMESKMETRTEWYTDHSGQRRTRTTTQPKASWRTEYARRTCPTCSGLGRRPGG